MYTFYNTGVTYWFTDTFHGNANGSIVTPIVGNLDLAEPEIVVNMDETLVVYNADGSIAWSRTAYASGVGMPVLADMNGDGLLDIIMYDLSGMVRVYNFNYGSPVLLWQYQLSSILSIVRGGPAVADVNGNGVPDLAISTMAPILCSIMRATWSGLPRSIRVRRAGFPSQTLMGTPKSKS